MMVAAAEKISLSLPSRSVVTIHHFSSDDAGTDWAARRKTYTECEGMKNKKANIFHIHFVNHVNTLLLGLMLLCAHPGHYHSSLEKCNFQNAALLWVRESKEHLMMLTRQVMKNIRNLIYFLFICITWSEISWSWLLPIIAWRHHRIPPCPKKQNFTTAVDFILIIESCYSSYLALLILHTLVLQWSMRKDRLEFASVTHNKEVSSWPG